MSDIDKNEQQQEEISLINDELKTISISDEKSSTVDNDSEQNRVHKKEDELQMKESIKIKEDESYDENDSEYEDVEENEFNEIDNTSLLTSVTNKNSFKTAMDDDDEIHINVKPRRMNKKHQNDDDEQSEGYENDDNQNVSKINKTKKLLDDDNNTSSPAYIPRKGKYYEHDDRTLNENIRSQQKISRNTNRFYTDSDGKWPHDLYFQDEQILKSRYVIPKRNYHSHFERHNNYNRGQFHLKDYIPRSQKIYNDYQHKEYYNNHRQKVPSETTNKSHNGQMNNFNVKDYNRDNTNIRKETQITSRLQQRNYDPYQIDERTFHRRRNFTNSQYQQQDNLSKFDNKISNRNDQRKFNENKQYHHFQGKNQQENRIFKKYEFNENKNNLPPRFQINNNYRNLTQKQSYQENLISSNISNNERPKRYSNMRNNMITPFQQQVSSSTTKIQHSNNIEQNDWPQAPPPPTSYLPQQIITPQIFYQQQSSRYVLLNYSQTSISEQFQNNK